MLTIDRDIAANSKVDKHSPVYNMNIKPPKSRHNAGLSIEPTKARIVMEGNKNAITRTPSPK